MPDDLPPDLERLNTLRVWHAMWLDRIDRRIAYVQKRQAEEEHGRRNRPKPPDWIVELSRATGEPLQVHDGACGMKGKQHRAVGRDEARRLLTTDAVPACPFCHPDTQLRIIGDLAARPGRPRPRLERSCYPARYSADWATCDDRPEQDPADAHDSPSPDHRARSVRADLSRRPGRPLLRVPAQDPQIRERRRPFVPVVHGARDGAVEFRRALHQHTGLTPRPHVPPGGGRGEGCPAVRPYSVG